VKPWLGAVAAATAIFAAPALAFASPDDPALLEFRLDNAGLYDDFEALGFDMDHNVDKGEGDDIIVRAWVNDEQLQLARAHGFENVGVIHDKRNHAAIRAETIADKEAEMAAKEALSNPAAAKSAAPDSIRAQRADRYTNNVGKFISIEANVDGVTYTGTNQNVYNGPTVVASWYDAQGNKLGEGNLAPYTDPDVRPNYYQYHYGVFRTGNLGDDTPEVASIRVASSNGDVDTLAAKQWVSDNPPPNSEGFKSGFVTRYYDSVDAYQKMRDLATEFPNIAESIDLPEKTWGYQRPAATMLGYVNTNNNAPNATTPYVRYDDDNLPVGGTAPTAGAQQNQTVVITTKIMGHLGGNQVTAQLLAPTGPNQPLTVSLTGNALRVNLASDAEGNPASTANQIVAAINAHPDASRIVRAAKYRNSTGEGISQPGVRSPLSDLLRAPAYIPRGPQTQTMLRIGKHRDGSKVGVYLYCQEHAGEIATSGVCLETAERLVRNYGTDPRTTALVDGLDIFIVPQINADGVIHSLYDSPRRTNMAPYCYDTANTENLGDPANRNAYGVNINRNFSVGSVFDGFQGASISCSGGNNAGPFELSEPETRNEIWVQNTFRNIKFSNNIHSSGGYFMWPPGSYTPQREALPYPPYGTLNFFDEAARHVLDGIKSHRGTAIRPQRTGPVIDVLYSAAGNSADEAYYTLGIIGYDFEIGDVHYYKNPVTGVETTCNPGQQPPFGDSANDCLDNEGFHEAMEFSDGNYGLLQSALDYANDVTPPVVEAVTGEIDEGKIDVRFVSNEASSIYYTTDGSTPTTDSTEWKPNRARALPLPLQLENGTVLKWIAHDFKGNLSEVKTLAIGFTGGSIGGSVPATLSLTLGGPASFGAFTPGLAKDYTASTTANVISTAGDATLSASSVHLTNGAFSLAQPLQVDFSKSSWNGPVSNDNVEIDFTQSIGANEGLRTGNYSASVTFTLSTTNP